MQKGKLNFRDRGQIFLSLPLLFLFLMACGRDAPRVMENSSHTESITPRDAHAGKWLVTISAGKGVSKNATLALRDELVGVFSQTKGGLYQHTIDLDDHHSANVDPNKENVMRAMDGLKKSIQVYQQQNPAAKTMVVFGLTGHGMTETSGTFYFQLTDGGLSGKEIVEIISSLGVDETLLVIQSCESGSLVENDFPNNSLFELKTQIEELAEKSGLILSVLTPVSRHILSPFFVWEAEILDPTLTFDNFDIDGDGIVSYQEWKNAVLKTSCLHKDFVPKEAFARHYPLTLPNVGIDPQIFDPKMPGQLPLFLTSRGVEQYVSGSLELHSYPPDPAQISSDTTNTCREQWEFFDFLFNAGADAVLKAVQSNSGIKKVKAIAHLSNRRYPFSDRILGVLLREIDTNPDPLARGEACRVIGEKGYKEGSNASFDEVIKNLIARFAGEVVVVQRRLAEALGNLKAVSGFSVLTDALQKHPDYEVRYNSVIALGALADLRAVSFLIESLLNDADESVREASASTLGDFKAKEALPALRKAAKNDPSAIVRSAAKYAITMIEAHF